MIVTRKYRYVYEDVTRRGQVRTYFWRGAGHRKVRMQERPGTPELDQHYGELLRQGEAGAFKPPPHDTQYQPRFAGLACSTPALRTSSSSIRAPSTSPSSSSTASTPSLGLLVLRQSVADEVNGIVA